PRVSAIRSQVPLIFLPPIAAALVECRNIARHVIAHRGARDRTINGSAPGIAALVVVVVCGLSCRSSNSDLMISSDPAHIVTSSQEISDVGSAHRTTSDTECTGYRQCQHVRNWR